MSLQFLKSKSQKASQSKVYWLSLLLLIPLFIYGNCSKVSMYQFGKEGLGEKLDEESEMPKVEPMALTKNIFTLMNEPVTDQVGLAKGFKDVNVQVSLRANEVIETLTTPYGQVEFTNPTNFEFTYTPNYGFRGLDEFKIYLFADGFEPGEISVSVEVFHKRNLINTYSLAVRGPGCIVCHSQIKGTFVTDFGAGLYNDDGSGGQLAKFMGLGDRIKAENLDPDLAPNWLEGVYAIYSNVDNVLGNAFDTLLNIEPIISGSPSFVVPNVYLDTGTPLPPAETGFNLEFSRRWNEEIDRENYINLFGYSYLDENNPKKLDQYLNEITGESVQTYDTVKISAPTRQKLLSIWEALQNSPNIDDYKIYDSDGNEITNALYVPEELNNKVDLIGLKQDLNGVIYNEAQEDLLKDNQFICEGDIIINGIARFQNIDLVSITGCRIYATETIFINAPIYVPSNIQFSSARAISFGMGSITSAPCDTRPRAAYLCLNSNSFKRRLGYFTQDGGCSNSNSGQPARETLNPQTFFTSLSGLSTPETERISLNQFINDIIDDIDLADNMASLGVIEDASCHSDDELLPYDQMSGFEHILLNAPTVQGRYGGLFKGMIVAETVDWAKKRFNFENDPVFSIVPLLPLVNFEEDVLKVE